MTYVTCGLTAKNRDQLWNHTLCIRVWATLPFFHIVSGAGCMKQCGVCFFLPWAHSSSKPAAAGLPLWAQQAGDNQSIAAAAACNR